MRPSASLLILVPAVIALSLAACDNSGGSATTSGTPSEATTGPSLETSSTTTTTIVSPPPPLTHRQFIRQLDRLCKVGNRVGDRRFTFTDVYDTAASMDAYAVKLAKVNRFYPRVGSEAPLLPTQSR